MADKQKQTDQLIDYVSDADHFILQQTPLRGKIFIWLALLLLLLFVVWAYYTQLNELVRGSGKVVPSSQLQILQSIDGGNVKKILVKEGDSVVANQALIEIDSIRYESELQKDRALQVSLRARAERLNAFLDNRAFVTPKNISARDAEVYQQEKRFYQNALSEIQAKKNQALAKKNQAIELLSSSEEELRLNRPLLEVGAVSEVEILRLEREVNRLKSDIKQADSALKAIDLEFTNDIRNELSDTQSQLNSLNEGAVALHDKVNRSIIRSPMNGYVKRLLINTQGGVVRSGVDLIEIVPANDALLIETKITPRDIAFLNIGQLCTIKFTAYDFAVYGGMEGELISIGADSITDEEGETFFLVRIKGERSSLKEGLPIIPGMQAEVDINTGQKSVLTYLMKPILRAKQVALTER